MKRRFNLRLTLSRVGFLGKILLSKIISAIFIYLAIGLGTLLILSKSAFLWLNGSIAGSGISDGGELYEKKIS